MEATSFVWDCLICPIVLITALVLLVGGAIWGWTHKPTTEDSAIASVLCPIGLMPWLFLVGIWIDCARGRGHLTQLPKLPDVRITVERRQP